MQIYRPIILDFETREQLYKYTEDLIMDRVLDVLGEQGVVRLAFSGGKTPLPLYSRLGLNPILDWSRVELFQTDERYIEPTNFESNQYQIKQCLKPVENEIKNFYTIDTTLPIDITVKDYVEKLDSLEDPFFDVTILGIGPDGHFASLFPEGKYLGHTENTVIQTVAPKDFAIGKRISLSVESILNTKEIIVLLVGENKQNIIGEMLEGSSKAIDFPAKFLLAHPNLKIYQCLS